MTSGTPSELRLVATMLRVQVELWSKLAYGAAALACALPGFIAIRDGSMSGSAAATWVTATTVFAVLFGSALRGAPGERRGRAAAYSVIAQTLAGMTMVFASTGLSRYTSAITLVLVAQQLPNVFFLRSAWLWIASQSVVLAAVFWWSDGWLGGLSGGAAFAGFQVFALGRSLLQRSERQAREGLSRANAELYATRELLAASSRAAERLRISRDLHDALGHHLTALSIRLEIASRLTSGAAAEHLREAHAIARLLLADVRSVVSELRDRGRIDVAEAIRSFTLGVTGPQIHLDLPPTLFLDHSAEAETLIRCVQEIITNATRHAGARNVWIRLVEGSTMLELSARDDGSGSAAVVPGHGLKGMQERFAEHAGRVEFATMAGSGFEVRAFLPRRGESLS